MLIGANQIFCIPQILNKKLEYNRTVHVRWVLCHYGMACPQIANGGDKFQIWRAAVNILNKQSWPADKGWSSSLGVGRGANNSSL
jgi:hypothetical protein